MSMEKEQHKRVTLDFFKQAALEKDGFYDADDVAGESNRRHSIWQRRVRAHLTAGIRKIAGAGGSLLDVGCGNGDFVRELAGAFPAMIFRGHDFSPEMIEVAKAQYADVPNLSYATQDLLNIDPALGRFDIVLCLNMFHHLHSDDLDNGMDSLATLTGRRLLFEIKNENNFWNRKFRPAHSFPFNLLSPARARRYLSVKGLRFVGQWNIFLFEFLSPIVILEFSRDAD